MQRLLAFLSRQSRLNLLFVSLTLTALISLLETLTPAELSFSLFYLLPALLTGWYVGRGAAAVVILITAIFWTASDFVRDTAITYPLVPYWNLLMRIGILWAFIYLLLNLRQQLLHESALSRTDALTGIANGRAFFEVAQREISRSQRYHSPTTVAYFDCDNFKAINDRYGHNTGDDLLRVVALTLRNNIRATDIATRLGGDEFVVLMPETNHVRARPAVQKLRTLLLRAMQERSWPVTFSIGVMTYTNPPANTTGMIQEVDKLMYVVKNGPKDGIHFAFQDPNAQGRDTQGPDTQGPGSVKGATM